MTCNIITMSLVLIKLLTSFIYNEELVGIIRYAKTNFWHSNYDTSEKLIMNKCQRTCNYLVFVFTFFAQGTVLGFILRPILGKRAFRRLEKVKLSIKIKNWFAVNRGRNESDRILPFNMWLELPLSITPYFEVMFVVQVYTTIHSIIQVSFQETIVSSCTGRIRVSRVRVLPLLRQPLVHFESAHCRPVSYLAVQIRQYLRRRTGEAGWKIGAQFPRILEAESLHSTASSSYRVLQKIGTSVQFNSIWTGVTFQLADVPRWISDTHGIFSDPSKVHYYFSIHRSCFINDRHNFDNPLLFFILLKILPGRHPFRKTRHFRVSHNWLHLSTVDVHVQLRLLDKGEHGCSRCRVQLLVVVSADG